MKIVGIDLAWQNEVNTTALAIGELEGNIFQISKIHQSLSSLGAIKNTINSEHNVQGISIDAPLVINNHSGQRTCEKELSKEYGSRWASCHTSNTKLYPNSPSVALSDYLLKNNFIHLGEHNSEKWQIECYPHPALIEIFGLSERLPYKKGKVSERKQGQINLSRYIRKLADSEVLKLTIDSSAEQYLIEESIQANSGSRVKKNEDALDSIMCAYIGALYAISVPQKTFGAIEAGYIYVPKQKCIHEASGDLPVGAKENRDTEVGYIGEK